jgi:SAM-dependent methyltransferase
VSDGESFADGVREIARVLQPGGRFLFSLGKVDDDRLEGQNDFRGDTTVQ